MEIDQVYYNANSQWLLSVVLACMVLGVALDIRWRDFKAVLTMPRAVLAGLAAQFIALPALTCGLTLLLDLPAGIELGMMLVAACPGGAVSNFITQLAGGNTALSISMTAAASALATIMLPLNFMFWSQLNPVTLELMTTIDVSRSALFVNLLLVLALPLMLGLTLRQYWPKLAGVLHQVLKNISIVALFAFIAIAVLRNQQAFMAHFGLIFSIVLGHNLLALLLGFSAGKYAKLSIRDIKATTIEVGMQNSSLAIAIVFSQFNGQPGMALICAFWGTWHIVSGLLLALSFNRWGKSPLTQVYEKNQ